MPFIKLAATEIVSGVSGESEQKVRELFSRAVVREHVMPNAVLHDKQLWFLASKGTMLCLLYSVSTLIWTLATCRSGMMFIMTRYYQYPYQYSWKMFLTMTKTCYLNTRTLHAS